MDWSGTEIDIEVDKLRIALRGASGEVDAYLLAGQERSQKGCVSSLAFIGVTVVKAKLRYRANGASEGAAKRSPIQRHKTGSVDVVAPKGHDMSRRSLFVCQAVVG
jgi:hypothetical protein